jgi:16S rRNA (cytidine1402-2'-O)-methyltransferase
VFFEAPHRVRDTLEAVLRVLGDRQIAVGRELTKIHEEYLRGTVSDVLSLLAVPRGEFTIVLGGAPEERPAVEPLPSSSELLEIFGQMTNGLHMSRREAINKLAERHSQSSREVYRAIEEAKRSSE